MFEIFSNVQLNKTSHQKYEKKLRKIYEKGNFDEFRKSFLNALVIPLSRSDKISYVENALQFAAKSAVNLETLKESEAHEELNPLLTFIIVFLFAHHNADDPNVRFRVCYFLNMLMNFMSAKDASLDDSLWFKIIKSMELHFLVKSAKVRVQAVRALHGLQDTMDPNCSVIKMYIYHLSKDPNADEVRKAVFTGMANNKVMLQAVLKRSRDIDEYVRKMSYEFISKVTVRSLSIKQREELLNDGLKDKSITVRKTVGGVLLPSWLDYFKGDHVPLVRALDPEIGTEVALMTLNVLLNYGGLFATRLISFNSSFGGASKINSHPRSTTNTPTKKMSYETSILIQSFGLNLAVNEKSLTISAFASTNLGAPKKFKKVISPLNAAR